MDIFILIFFGGIVAWLVSKPQFELKWDLILGVMGAMASHSLMESFGLYGVTGYNLYSFVIAMIGSLVVIYIGRTLTFLKI